MGARNVMNTSVKNWAHAADLIAVTMNANAEATPPIVHMMIDKEAAEGVF